MRLRCGFSGCTPRARHGDCLPKPANTSHPASDRSGAGGFLPAAAAHPMAFAAALFLLCAIGIGWPWLSGRVTIPWDAKAHFQPQIQFLAQSLARGESPAWAPYVFSGYPQIADPQAMIFSPPFLALALIDGSPSLWAVDATVLAFVALGGLALMLWFRDRGWHWAGGLIAALAFCYGASMAWRIQHIGQVLSLAYLPVALLCLDRALERGSVVYGIGAGVVGAAILLGRDQVALLSIYLLAAYGLWRIFGADRPGVALRRSLLPIGAGAACALVLIAVPLLLTAMLAQDSNRSSIDYDGAARGSLHPALLLTLVMPDVFGASGRMEDYWGPPSFAWPDTGLFIAQNMGELYIGAIPLVLLAVAAVRGQLWGREIQFFTCAAAFCLALCARVVHAGVPRALHAAARRQPVPAAGRRDVPGRRPGRDPGGVCGASAAAEFLADGVAIGADAGAGGGDHAGRRRTAVDRSWACGSAARRVSPRR